MAKALRWGGRILIGLFALVAVAALAVFFLSQRALGDTGNAATRTLAQPTPAQLAEATRLLNVHGCTGCHGADLAGKPFDLDPAVATLYAPNLTRLAAAHDDATLDRAIRGGIGADGRALVVMPSAGYQAMSDQEVAALIDAIRRFPVTGRQWPERRVGPLGRIGLVSGQFETQPALVARYAAAPLPDLGDDTARGRSIVAVNCAECHGTDLKGREVMPGLSSADLTMAGAYDLGQFETLLRTGAAPGGKPLRLMDDVAKTDFAHMTDAEIEATHAYLVAFANR